jgi:polyisoprenoid-binding protein YceI
MNRYELDTHHTDLGFTAKHMVFTTVRGRFNEYDGFVEVDGDDFTNAKGEFTLQVASIDSANEKRDEHLRSADFFNAAEYPVLTFRPAGVAAKGDDRYAVTGDLTIRDVTKPIELDVKVEGRIPKDAFGKERIAVSATGTVNRKDWGLNWNMALETGGFLVSEEIKIVVEAAFVADARVTAEAVA